MRKCPICGAYMTFRMRYHTGKTNNKLELFMWVLNRKRRSNI